MKNTSRTEKCDSLSGLPKAIEQASGDTWMMYRGDCCELIRGIPDDSIHYSLFSPPFSSLYVYSDSERDMGNSVDDAEFFQHFSFLISELHRVIMPGRLVSVHCMNLPSTKQHNGYIGLRDFRGEIIRLFCESGFVYHSEVCIWKDPVTAMQRTKAIGLLHKQLVKDSSLSRQGIPDYVCTFRKLGVNPDPIAGRLSRWHGDDSFIGSGRKPGYVSEGDRSIDIWQRYASPVWMDINQSRTLNIRAARHKDDERHICPLQLDVISRCLELWTNPGDVVLSPFAGIGSEGYVSVQLERKFIGFELKESYFKCACKDLDSVEIEANKPRLF